ncbi:MAG: acyl-CoA dehydratase activase [Thermodesulfobacteriota bacterium]
MGWDLGVDLGAYSCKVVLLGPDGPVGWLAVPSGTHYTRTAQEAVERLLAANQLTLRSVRAVVATGIGAPQIDFADSVVGDVICTARGTAAAAPSVRTVIDIGSQATRVVWLDEVGRVAHFSSNEKCATGSGRFLQVIANVLRVRLEDVGALSLQSTRPVTFTTGCAVFGESEAITRVSEGVAREDILAGVHRALAEKIGSLVRTHGAKPECAVSGGGALDVGLLRQLESHMGTSLRVLDRPQMVGALGAAVLASRLAEPGTDAASAAVQRRPARRAAAAETRPRAVRLPPSPAREKAAEIRNERASRSGKAKPSPRGETP